MPLLTFLLVAFIPASDSLPDSLRVERSPAPVMTVMPAPPAFDEWLSQDKFLHFYFSATLTGLGYHAYADQMKGDRDRGKIISVSLTALLGLSKEIYDQKKKNHFSWKDLAWDGLGIAAGYLLFVHL